MVFHQLHVVVARSLVCQDFSAFLLLGSPIIPVHQESVRLPDTSVVIVALAEVPMIVNRTLVTDASETREHVRSLEDL